jgi:hypothetical protein
MRVLFTASAWLGHYYPMVPLGWALQADGHEVRVLCDPGQADAVAGTGLTPVPVLEHGDLLGNARLGCYLEARDGRWPYPVPPLHPDTGEPLASVADFDFASWFIRRKRTWWPQAGRSADAAAAVARDWRPDLVVYGPQSLEGALAAAVAGAPSVVQLWGPLGPGDDGPGLPLLPVDITSAFERHATGIEGPGPAALLLDPCPAAVAAPTDTARQAVRYLPVRRYPPAHTRGAPGWRAAGVRAVAEHLPRGVRAGHLRRAAGPGGRRRAGRPGHPAAGRRRPGRLR